MRSGITITVGLILLLGLGMLSHSKYSESDLPLRAGKWKDTSQISSSAPKVMPDASNSHLIRPHPASKNDPSAEADGRESVAKTLPGYSENFEVVDNSFVRDQPQPNAAIIATLRPGTRVRVESKTGDYLRVRSLSDADVIGYVHEEDAFFHAR